MTEEKEKVLFEYSERQLGQVTQLALFLFAVYVGLFIYTTNLVESSKCDMEALSGGQLSPLCKVLNAMTYHIVYALICSFTGALLVLSPILFKYTEIDTKKLLDKISLRTKIAYVFLLFSVINLVCFILLRSSPLFFVSADDAMSFTAKVLFISPVVLIFWFFYEEIASFLGRLCSKCKELLQCK